AEAAKRHLADCPDCQARQLYLRSSLAEMVALLSPDVDTPLPDGGPSRAQLKAQMQHASSPGRKGWLERLEIAVHRQPPGLLYAELVVMVLAVCLITWRGVSSINELSAGRSEVTLEPDHVLTPGATRPVTLAEICPLNDEDLDPDVAPSKRQAIFDAYGINTK